MDELTKHLEERNAELEKKVAELSRQVQHKDLRLKEAMTQMKQMQEHLVQMEKMSMLGQMVAGISHEINNPINFIYGNLPYVEEHIEALLKVIEVYQSAYEIKAAVEDVLSEVELDYVLEDLPRIVESMKLGAERIRELVLNLRNFYRLDECQMKEADINAGIESTLVMLHNRYKQKIEIVRQYGELPPVECHINQLSQVFMNLLSNAIDALLAKEAKNGQSEEETAAGASSKKQIAIATQLVGADRISISISDNGLGINPEVKTRVFEPFFTTKPIGVGTGLGLSISHQIVTETHGGKIYCFSTLGEGTTFMVELPVCQSNRREAEELSLIMNEPAKTFKR
ncbi:MAG: histidine kinase [Microcoleus vaginatus WJT46-NPBG5]|nr:histidine kinase [Microcoleus vaginatus WJT46-NPBG5]